MSPPKLTGLSMPAASDPRVPLARTLVGACWRWAERQAQRLWTRRTRPGPAFAAMREFNGPTRRCPLERQTRDPRGRWGRRP